MEGKRKIQKMLTMRYRITVDVPFDDKYIPLIEYYDDSP